MLHHSILSLVTCHLSRSPLQPLQVIRVALVQVLELEDVVEQVAVELAAFAPIRERALDLDEACARLLLADAFEAAREFGFHLRDYVIAVAVEAVVFGARQVEEAANPADLVATEGAVFRRVEEWRI